MARVVVALDFETTGFSAGKGDRVVQLASLAARVVSSTEEDPDGRTSTTACRHRWAPLDSGDGSFARLVRPSCGRLMNPHAQKVTGISDALLRTEKPFRDVFTDWLSWLWKVWPPFFSPPRAPRRSASPESEREQQRHEHSDAKELLFVAHNAEFDASFFRAELERCGVAPGGIWLPPGVIKTTDSLAAAKLAFPKGAGLTPTGRPSWSLDALHRSLFSGEPVPNAHDALADCDALLRCLAQSAPLFDACLRLAQPAAAWNEAGGQKGWFAPQPVAAPSALSGIGAGGGAFWCPTCQAVFSRFFCADHANGVCRRQTNET